MVSLVPALVLLAACGGSSTAQTVTVTASPPSSASTFILTGTVDIHGFNGVKPVGDHSCEGNGGYSDLRPGAAVVVTDEAGTILAKDAVATALYTAEPIGCTLKFSAVVPEGEKFYQVAVGNRDPYVATSAEAHQGLDLAIN